MVGTTNHRPSTVSRKTPLTENAAEFQTFVEMAREFPVRTSIFTFGLPAFAALQVVSALFSDGSALIVAGVAIMMVVFSIGLTRYHVAAYRRQQVERRLANSS